jgi:hypothetical protein
LPEAASSVTRAGTLASMIRVLVTLSPLMYRQAIALCIHHNRPGLVDVRIAPPEAIEDQLASFRPHLLVHNDEHGGLVPVPEPLMRAVPHRVEVLYSNGMDALLSADGSVTELRDASIEDLLGAVDEAAEMADREDGSG